MLQPVAAIWAPETRPMAWAYSGFRVAPIFTWLETKVPSGQTPLPPDSGLQAMNTGILAYFCKVRFCSRTLAPGIPL